LDDIAILELESSLPPERSIKDTEYSKPTVGTAVVTMGYPLWYILGESSPSLTNGIVSKETHRRFSSCRVSSFRRGDELVERIEGFSS
jgi:hypothetical protein